MKKRGQERSQIEEPKKEEELNIEQGGEESQVFFVYIFKLRFFH